MFITVAIPVEKFELAGHRVLDHYKVTVPVTRESQRSVVTGEYFYMKSDLPSYCSLCGARVSWELTVKGDDFSARVLTPCLVKRVVPYTMRIPVPSGKLVYADSIFRTGFQDVAIDSVGVSYNSSHGKELYSRALEEIGVAYGFIANTCPSLWWNETTAELLVASKGYHEETEEEIAPDPNYSEVGSITTDLWAYSFTDLDNFHARGGQLDKYLSILSVRPGVYEFTHFANADDFRWDEYGSPTVYAHGRRIS